MLLIVAHIRVLESLPELAWRYCLVELLTLLLGMLNIPGWSFKFSPKWVNQGFATIMAPAAQNGSWLLPAEGMLVLLFFRSLWDRRSSLVWLLHIKRPIIRISRELINPYPGTFAPLPMIVRWVIPLVLLSVVGHVGFNYASNRVLVRKVVLPLIWVRF